MSDSARPIRIVVFAPEPISRRLTGPNIRALEMARQLAGFFHTVLWAPNETGLFQAEPFQTRAGSRRDALKQLDQFDVAVSQGAQYPARGIARASRRGPVQVFDLYDPLLFEALSGQINAGLPEDDQLSHLRRLTALILKRGDFFLCASPRQRDLWLGALYVLGRFGPRALRPRPEDYVAVAPFGHSGENPIRTRSVLKGVYPGIAAGDKIVLWGGGIWNWLDPLTLIRAMGQIATERPDVKLFFLAARGPGKESRGGEMAQKAQSLAREMGLVDRAVFFNEEWVAFEERANWLLEADLAVCTAPEGMENAFSFRTRLVDAVWARTPIVCTHGGFMGHFVENNEIGLTASGQNVADLKAKILAALKPDMQHRFRANLAARRDALAWDNCLRPLVEFCRKVERGEFRRPPERYWAPWLQYCAYKAPTLLERAFTFPAKPL